MEKPMKPYKFDEEEPEEKPEEEPEKETPKDEGMREKFLKTRTILIFGEINQRMAQSVTEQLLLLPPYPTRISRLSSTLPAGMSNRATPFTTSSAT